MRALPRPEARHDVKANSHLHHRPLSASESSAVYAGHLVFELWFVPRTVRHGQRARLLQRRHVLVQQVSRVSLVQRLEETA